MVFRANPAADWKRFGEIDPYFGVLSNDKFKSKNLNDENKERFFTSGERQIEKTIKAVENIFGKFERGNALDFGCGTGRLTCALAKHFNHVVGLDISAGMLNEARKEIKKRNINNIIYDSSENPDLFLPDTYDFVHSYIVFQHIPPKIGRKLINDMIRSLKTGGVGAIHLTFSETKTKPFPQMRALAKDFIPLRVIGNIYLKRKWNYSAMQMNNYNLSEIIKDLMDHNIYEVQLHRVDDWGNLGVFLFFQKPEPTKKSLWDNPIKS